MVAKIFVAIGFLSSSCYYNDLPPVGSNNNQNTAPLGAIHFYRKQEGMKCKTVRQGFSKVSVIQIG